MRLFHLRFKIVSFVSVISSLYLSLLSAFNHENMYFCISTYLDLQAYLKFTGGLFPLNLVLLRGFTNFLERVAECLNRLEICVCLNLDELLIKS